MSKKEQKKITKKQILIILILIEILAITATIAINRNKKNNIPDLSNSQEQIQEKINTSEELAKTKNFFGYEVSGTKLKQVNNQCKFTTTVKNTTDSTLGDETIYIVFKSDSGKEIYKMEQYIPKIEPGKAIDINLETTIDIIKMHDIEFVK